MKLGNVTFIIAITLGVTILSNCHIQKRIFTTDLQTENKNEMKQISISQIELNEYELEKEICETKQNVVLPVKTSNIHSKSLVSSNSNRTIRKYDGVFVDASSFLEKKEKRKCYDQKQQIEVVSGINNDIMPIKVAAFFLPVLFPSVLLLTLISLMQMIKKLITFNNIK